MKKIMLALALFLLGCEREMQSFEGDRGIYFAVQWGASWGGDNTPYRSHTPIDFVAIVGDTYTAKVKVMITDGAKDFDREFKYRILPETTTGVAGEDFETPEGVGIIPAGGTVGYVTVELNRTAKMADGVVEVGMELLPNDNFTPVFKKFLAITQFDGVDGGVAAPREFDATRHTLSVSDVLVQPANWLGGWYQYGNFEEFNTFGVFGAKKFNLICEITGVVYADFMDSSIMTYGYMGVLGRRVANYLVEQYKAGTPIQEADGRLMWVGGCRWRSYENVPWDGVINPEYFTLE